MHATVLTLGADLSFPRSADGERVPERRTWEEEVMEGERPVVSTALLSSGQ